MYGTTFTFLSNLRINPSRLGYTEKEQNTSLYFGLPFTSQSKRGVRSPTDKTLHPCRL